MLFSINTSKAARCVIQVHLKEGFMSEQPPSCVWARWGGVELQALPRLVATQGQFQCLVLQVQVELQTRKMFLQGLQGVSGAQQVVSHWDRY